MVPQHLVYKADQLLRRALDLAQEPVLHNTYQRAHVEPGQHGELLLPGLIPQLRGNQTDRALDNSTDIRLEEPLQVVPTHRAKGAEAERTILLQVLEKLEQAVLTRTAAGQEAFTLRYAGKEKAVTLAQGQPLTVAGSEF